MYAAELLPRAKPGYVHSLSCDPVKFSQDLGRANLTLAFTQNGRLLASRPTSELIPQSTSTVNGDEMRAKVNAFSKLYDISMTKAKRQKAITDFFVHNEHKS